MSLLGDIRNQKHKPDHARGLVHGQPGTGKTTLIGTMAELGPMLYMYVKGEEGIGSLTGIKGEENLTVHRLGSLTGNPVQEVEAFYYDLLSGDHEYVTVAIESVSALQSMVKKHLLRQPFDEPARERPATDYAFWGALNDWFTDFFTFWFGLASSTNKRPVHVVMTSQTKATDDAEGQAKMQPDLNRGPLGPALTRPDQILYTHMTEDPEDWEKQLHVVRLKPSDSVAAKTRCAPEVAERLPEVMGTQNRPNLPAYLRLAGVAGV